MPIEAKQSLKECIDDAPLGLPGDQCWIKGLRLGSIDKNQIGMLLMRRASRTQQQATGEE